MVASGRRAFRLPVLALGLSLLAWAGLTFSAMAPKGRDMEIRFGKYLGMKMSDVLKKRAYCQWILEEAAEKREAAEKHSYEKPPTCDFLEAEQYILENAPEIANMGPIVNFGKYKGKFLSDICEDNPGYCRWILETAEENRKVGEVGGPLNKAADWIQKHRPDFLANIPDEVKKHAVC